MKYKKKPSKAILPPGVTELMKKGYPLHKAVNIAGLKGGLKKPKKKK